VGSVTPALSIKNLSVIYDGHHALKNADLDVRPGESFGLVGESGSGKSTMLRALPASPR
jgi:peptide/nickel transport system ATP-binding protein